jgi:multicomponent Na+:H+ antiporter subunit G
MIEYLTGILLIVGSFFCLVAALGVIRLPDPLTRMHAATKAGSLGAGLLVIAHALFYQELGISLRAISIIALLLFTAPVAAHLIARTFYRSGEALSERIWIDELKGK